MGNSLFFVFGVDFKNGHTNLYTHISASLEKVIVM